MDSEDSWKTLTQVVLRPVHIIPPKKNHSRTEKYRLKSTWDMGWSERLRVTKLVLVKRSQP